MSPVDLPLVIGVSCDEVVRQTSVASLLVDLPGAVCVDYAVLGHEPGASSLVRRVLDWTGPVYSDEVELDHGCVSCAVREDVVATVELLARQRRWSAVVVLPPLTSSPAPLAHALHHAIADGGLPGVSVTAVVSFVDLARLDADLLGDDLLAERGLALGPADRRSVGEALAAQLEFSDVVVAASGPVEQVVGPTNEAVLRRVVDPSTSVHLDWTRFPASTLVEGTYDHVISCARVDPLRVWPVHADDASGVWTLELATTRPLHPLRLLARITDLGSGRIRARGHFWLASRPDVACAWDASGGQLSIGTIGGWAGQQPGTRLSVTGVDPDDRARIARAFDAVPLTHAEEGDQAQWGAGPDGFEPWLG